MSSSKAEATHCMISQRATTCSSLQLILAGVVVQRGAGVLEDGNVQKALQADLQDAQTAIHDEHDGCQQEGKWMAALKGQHCDKEAHCAAAGIAHQQAGRLCVGPQIGQQRTHEHNACGAVLGQLCFIGQQLGADGHHCNTCRKASTPSVQLTH